MNRVLKYILCIVLILLGYMHIETYLIEEKTDVLTKNEVPSSFDGYKIVYISDIHYGLFFPKWRVKRVVDRVNALNPDLILLGGDYINYEKKDLDGCFDELKKLKSKDGIYAILGNHDFVYAERECIEAISASGIKFIENRSEWISNGKDRIKVGGVGYLIGGEQRLGETIKDVRKEDFVMLMSHHPNYVNMVGTDRVDIMFSGHSHGGQLTFFGLWAPIVPSDQNIRTGMIEMKNLKLLVSNGIGTTGVPLRFFARPQINTVILKKKLEFGK